MVPYALGVTPEPSATPSSPNEPPPRSLGVAVARYGLARAGLVVLVTVLLVLVGVPLLVALLVGLVVALPVSLLLFGALRRDLDLALAEAGRRRAAQKARLRARLSGADPEDGVESRAEDDAERRADSRAEGGSADAGSRQREADGGAQRPDQHDESGTAEHRDEVAPPGAGEHPTNR